MYKCCRSVLNFKMYWGLASITDKPTMSFSISCYALFPSAACYAAFDASKNERALEEEMRDDSRTLPPENDS